MDITPTLKESVGKFIDCISINQKNSSLQQFQLQRSRDDISDQQNRLIVSSHSADEEPQSNVMGGGFATSPYASGSRLTSYNDLNNENLQMHEKLLDNEEGCEKAKSSREKCEKSKTKFAEKLRRSFRRTEHKSFEVKRQYRSDPIDGKTEGKNQEAKSLKSTQQQHQQQQQQQPKNSPSIFSLTNLPGLGGHINPALLLDSPDESTPPEFGYRHLSSVATTNSSTSLESNFCESPTTATSISYWSWHLNNSNNNNMGAEVSTTSTQQTRDKPATSTESKRHLEQQSSSKSDTHSESAPPLNEASRSCSSTSESSTAAKLTRLQNFLFKSSNESSRSIQGHSNEGFTASSRNSSSGEWENLCALPSTTVCNELSNDKLHVSMSQKTDDSPAGSYYQYTLASPSNPFLPEITARTYHSTYDETEELKELDEEELDANVTSVKYHIGSYSAQMPTPNYSRAGSQESTHSDCAPCTIFEKQLNSCSSTPGTHKRKLFSLSTPTKLNSSHQMVQKQQQQQQQQQKSLAVSTKPSTSTNDTFASIPSKSSTIQTSLSLVRSLNPFIPTTTVTSSSPPPPSRTTSSSSLNRRIKPLKQMAITSPTATVAPKLPKDLNAKREEFLRATMQICLVVSPPSTRLQLKSKSLTHLDGLGTETVCNHAKNNANVSSSEYFSVSFCMESGFQEEEFFPATKGVTLANALNQAIKRRNLSFSQLNITDINDDNSTQHLLDAKYKPLQRSLDENTEVEQLAGHHLMITDKEGSRKTLQKAASFGSRSRPPRLLSSASTDESSDVNLSGKQLKQRWSGLFGVKNPQQSQLCELLNNYSKTGVPQKTIPTYDFEHPDLEAAVTYLDNIHKSWRDIVQSDRMSDSEMRIQTAIWELVTTEVDYIHCLQTVTDLFLACLEAVQDEGLLQDVDQYRLFANIREICEANLKFWTFYLYPMVSHSIAMNEPLRVGFFQSGFIQFANIFSPYKKYCAEQSSCQFYCKELNRNNSVFTSYLAWCEAQKMCNRLRLADILVRPMQRLTKYSLLLAAIKKHMSDVEEIEAIDAMVQNTENFVFSVNNHLTTRQENERLKGVMARIESYDVVDTNNDHLDKLIKQYSQMFDLCGPMKGCASQHVRHLFMEGDHKYKDNHGKSDVHCFLLTDMLLVCKSMAKKGLGSLKVIRQPYLTDRLVVQHANNILSCVYLNEFQVAITAFTLQCTEAKSWYESLKRAKMVYARLKQCSTSNWESNLRYTGSIISAAGTIDSLGVKKSPLNSSICSHVTSANNSHSGSVDWNDSRNISVDFEKTNSLSSDEGCSYLGAHGFPVKAKPVTTISPQKLKMNTVSIANTLAVQPLHHLGQSLPNLTLHHSQANNTLLVPGTTSSHSGNVLLSPSHRGISYPPPNPSRVPLRRGMAFSSSIKNPPLLKTRNITSQNSINWHQIPATPTPTSPTTHQLPQQPANQNSFPKTIEAENINTISPSILSNSLAYNFNNPSDTTQSETNNASRISNLPSLNSNQTFTTQLSNTETDV
ncbi:uncharacterized protein LOC119645272 isoform X2 [Glossina fuscipes]|uniref:Uncharacterized protein LOC119645272 isoform X2 n=1 Tax=Glossina fuscipes TaxID=7396 RepID=A0A9C5ZPS8_9MUSC|nr:uncharacterized protein LOC119645272 isoform X2 [Glossina fuscipes]